MAQLFVLGIMLICAIVPFVLLIWLVRAGQSGLALTIVSVIGGTLAIFFYATGRPLGVDPVFAMTVTLLVCVPALLGSIAGALLGWLLRRQDDRRTK